MTRAYLSTSFSSNIAKGILNGTAYDFTALSGSLYLGLLTSSSFANEVSGGSYTRQPITFGVVGSYNYAANTNAISFTGLPDAVVSHFALFSGSTGSNEICYWACTNTVGAVATIPVISGDGISIGIGHVTLIIN